MIYFEFLISRDPLSDATETNCPTAEFMFDSDNPGECTRRAVTLLRAKGWTAISVKHAMEAFTLSDFRTGKYIPDLYSRAQAGGLGFCVHDYDLATATVERDQIRDASSLNRGQGLIVMTTCTREATPSLSA